MTVQSTLQTSAKDHAHAWHGCIVAHLQPSASRHSIYNASSTSCVQKFMRGKTGTGTKTCMLLQATAV